VNPTKDVVGIWATLAGSTAAICDVDSVPISVDVRPPIMAPTVEITDVSQLEIEPKAVSARLAYASSWLSVQLVSSPM
jgi:hypothetical protein